MSRSVSRIARQIGIDMGHRVTHHGSKCRNLHGHRYTIEATLEGVLVREGEQQGMVMDFGFLKDQMMSVIDTPCDHGLCLWIEDHLASVILGPAYNFTCAEVRRESYTEAYVEPFGKLYLMSTVPTAENLARHWHTVLAQALDDDPRNPGATLYSLRVQETPNCYAEYCPSGQ